MAKRKPLVLDSNAELQQLQSADQLSVPSIQDQLDSTRTLLVKLVAQLVSIGLPIEEPELLELLNEINT